MENREITALSLIGVKGKGTIIKGCVKPEYEMVYIDPSPICGLKKVRFIQETANSGLPIWLDEFNKRI